MDTLYEQVNLEGTLRQIRDLLAQAHTIADPILQRWAEESPAA